MPRYEREEGKFIRVAYGVADPSGVFLSVYDKRLKYDPKHSVQVNAVTEGIEAGGNGCYLDLRTGPHGFGQRVDDDTMATYLRRYGASEEQIALLPLHLKENIPCNACGKLTIKKCSRCKEINYCSKECQRDTWIVHRVFCGIETLSYPSQSVGSTITVLLLPENNKTPKLAKLTIKGSEASPLPPQVVEIPSDASSITDSGVARFDDAVDDVDMSSVVSPRAVLDDSELDFSRYIEGRKGVFRSEFYPGADSNLSCAYHLIYKDDFLEDGTSTENSSLANIVRVVTKWIYKDHVTTNSGEITPIHFRGTLLVLKREKSRGASKYLDIGPKDMQDVAKLLFKVNAEYAGG